MTIQSERTYLQKHRFAERQILVAPPKGLGMVVVIPCYGEPNLIRTLQSLEGCKRPNRAVEVIIVVNASEKSPKSVQAMNRKTQNLVKNWVSGKNEPFATTSFISLPFPSSMQV